MAFRSGVCKNHALGQLDNGRMAIISPNTGFVSWTGNSLSSTPILTFAHEVGHNLGARHDGDSNTCNPSHYMMAAYSKTVSRDHSKIFSSCSKNILRRSCKVWCRYNNMVSCVNQGLSRLISGPQPPMSCNERQATIRI